MAYACSTILSCNIELCVGKLVALDYISYAAPNPYHLSVQDEETQEGTLMGHKKCLRCPFVSKNKACRLLYSVNLE